MLSASDWYDAYNVFGALIACNILSAEVTKLFSIQKKRFVLIRPLQDKH